MPQAVLTVAQFLKTVNIALEEAVFPYGVEVLGEVAEYRVSQSKWIWFKLKDEEEEGVVECFATVWQLRVPLEDGMKVRIRGAAKVFQKSGKFTLSVEQAEPVGQGALKRGYELLKRKLEAEGLFAPGRKREIPRFPERIGLIASTESAAYSDFLRIFRNRWNGADIRVAHVQVQGQHAVRDIVGAFAYFNAHPELADVLVLTRGGGSLEDLHAFNSEEVARAVFASKVPVVVGVGHERDESLADFAADVRASTPSNAAERLAPDRRDIERELGAMAYAMDSRLRSALAARDRRLLELETHLQEHVRSAREEFDAVLGELRSQLASFETRLTAEAFEVERSVSATENRFAALQAEATSALEREARLLATLDPNAVLSRGYAIVRDAGGRVVRSGRSVDIGGALRVELQEGALQAVVTAAE